MADFWETLEQAKGTQSGYTGTPDAMIGVKTPVSQKQQQPEVGEAHIAGAVKNLGYDIGRIGLTTFGDIVMAPIWAAGKLIPGEGLPEKLQADYQKFYSDWGMNNPDVVDYAESVSNKTEPFVTEWLGLLGPTTVGVALTMIPIVGMSLAVGTFLKLNTQEIYDAAISKGADAKTAQGVAIVGGAINTLSDMLGLSVLGGLMKGKIMNNMLTTLGMAFIAEGVPEGFQSLIADVASEWAAKPKGESAGQFADRMIANRQQLWEKGKKALLHGGATAVFFGGAAIGTHSLAGKIVKARDEKLKLERKAQEDVKLEEHNQALEEAVIEGTQPLYDEKYYEDWQKEQAERYGSVQPLIDEETGKPVPAQEQVQADLEPEEVAAIKAREFISTLPAMRRIDLQIKRLRGEIDMYGRSINQANAKDRIPSERILTAYDRATVKEQQLQQQKDETFDTWHQRIIDDMKSELEIDRKLKQVGTGEITKLEGEEMQRGRKAGTQPLIDEAEIGPVDVERPLIRDEVETLKEIGYTAKQVKGLSFGEAQQALIDAGQVSEGTGQAFAEGEVIEPRPDFLDKGTELVGGVPGIRETVPGKSVPASPIKQVGETIGAREMVKPLSKAERGDVLERIDNRKATPGEALRFHIGEMLGSEGKSGFKDFWAFFEGAKKSAYEMVKGRGWTEKQAKRLLGASIKGYGDFEVAFNRESFARFGLEGKQPPDNVIPNKMADGLGVWYQGLWEGTKYHTFTDPLTDSTFLVGSMEEADVKAKRDEKRAEFKGRDKARFGLTRAEIEEQMAKAQIQPQDDLGGVTREQVGNLLAKGDLGVLENITKAVKEYGFLPVQDAVRNEMSRVLWFTKAIGKKKEVIGHFQAIMPKVDKIIGTSFSDKARFALSPSDMPKVTRRGAEWVKVAKKTLKHTDDLREAGFILPDGTMIELPKGKFHGQLISNIVYDTFRGDMSDMVIRFIAETGSIRVGFDGADLMVDVIGALDRAQEFALINFMPKLRKWGGKVLIDVSDKRGQVIAGKRMDRPNVEAIDLFINEAYAGKVRTALDRVGFGFGGDKANSIANRVSAIEDNLKGVIKNWKNAPPIKVLGSIGEVGEEQAKLFDKAQPNWREANPKGVFFVLDGKPQVYMFADNLTDKTDAQRWLLEEVVGHYGFHGAFGDAVNGILDNVWMSYGESAQMGEILRIYALDSKTTEGRRRASEELLGRLSQSGGDLKFTQRMISLLRKVLRSLGFDVKLNDSDILLILQKSQSFVESGKRASIKEGARFGGRGQPVPWSYSNLVKVASDPFMPAKVQSLKNWLEKKQVKKEEMDWMGVDEWLAENTVKGRIDKVAFLDFLKAHQIEIREVVKGGKVEYEKIALNMTNERFKEVKEAIMDWLEIAEENDLDPSQMGLGLMDDYETVKEQVRKFTKIKAVKFINENFTNFEDFDIGLKGQPTKYKSYSEESEQNRKAGSYRELLLTVPTSYVEDGKGRKLTAMRFEGGHWDEANVAVHVRFDEQVGPNGERILYVDEVQSDWAGDIDKYGAKEEAQKQIDKAQNAFRNYYNELKAKYNVADNYRLMDPVDNVTSEAEWNKLIKLESKLSAAKQSLRTSVPDLPFANNYNEVAMKRMLRWAAEHGFDTLAWSTGSTQVKRWGTDRMMWKKFDNSKLVNKIKQMFRGVESFPGKIQKDLKEAVDLIEKETGLFVNSVVEDEDSKIYFLYHINKLSKGDLQSVLDNSELSVRSSNVLAHHIAGDRELAENRNFGRKSAREIFLAAKEMEFFEGMDLNEGAGRREYAIYEGSQSGVMKEYEHEGTEDRWNYKQDAQQALVDLYLKQNEGTKAKGWDFTYQSQFGGRAGGFDLQVEAERLAGEGKFDQGDTKRIKTKEDLRAVVKERWSGRQESWIDRRTNSVWNKMQEGDSGAYLPRKEGMEGAYDEKLVGLMGKFVNKWGGKVETKATGLRRKNPLKAKYGDTLRIEETPGDEGVFYAVMDDADNINPFVAEFETREEAEKAIEEGSEIIQPLPMHQVAITPQMRESAIYEGFARFSLSPFPEGIRDVIGRKEGTVGEHISNALDQIKKKEWWDSKVITKLFDRLHPIKIHLSSLAYKLHRMSNSTYSALDMMMRHGKLYLDKSKLLNSDESGQGFVPWLHTMGKDANKFFAWVMARRAENLDSQGREFNLTADKRQKIYDWVGGRDNLMINGIPAEQLAKELDAFNSSVLDIAEASGLINPEARKSWQQDYYIPFFRLSEDIDAWNEYLQSPNKSMKYITAGIKKLKGAEMKVGDPLENILKNWMHLISESLRNNARAEAFNSGIAKGIIEQVEFKDLKIFRQGEGDKRKYVYVSDKDQRDVLVFQDKGRPTYFKVADPELFNALSGMDVRHLDGMLRYILVEPKHLLTYGATFGPAFRVANLLRDTLHTAAISKSFIPFVDSIRGLKMAWNETPEYISFMAAGGGIGGSYIHSSDPRASAKYIKKIINMEGAGAAKRVLYTLRKALDFWDRVGHVSENAARVAMYAKGKAEGLSHLDAAFEGRDIIDFSMKGSSHFVQFLIQTVPFLNARIQGNYKLGRIATNKETRKHLLVMGSSYMLASMGLWMAWKDDDRYKGLEDWDKWTYHHFWIGDKHFRFPRPFEFGVFFGSFPETVANTMGEDEGIGHLGDFVWKTLTETFAMDVPQLIKPMLEQWANKSFFTGRPIVGAHLEGLIPEEQADPWTSSTAQITAKLMAQFPVIKEMGSPNRIEAVVKGYLSVFGTMLLGGIDVLTESVFNFPEEPTKRIDDYPFVGRFIQEAKNPRYTTYQTKVYELFSDYDKIAKTMAHYRMTGNMEASITLANDNKAIRILGESFKPMRQQLKDIRSNMRMITYSGMSPEEKKKKLDRFIGMRNVLVQRGYKMAMDRLNK